MSSWITHRSPFAGLAVAAALGAFAASALASGRVEVTYAPDPSFADAGDGVVEVERTQRVLAGHLQALAGRLPAGQSLHVQVLDIDLAGELQHFWPQRVRVMGLGVDSPRLHLRYELRRGDAVLAAGEDRLLDPGYLWRGGRLHERGALPYERRMLDDWFEAKLATQAAALR